jgi:hypothetical protein
MLDFIQNITIGNAAKTTLLATFILLAAACF